MSIMYAQNTVLSGMVYGFLHVFGPDHLGTLMTLCAVTAPSQAFRLGATWGLCHCFGMLGVGALFLVLDKTLPGCAQTWEHVGDYLIGASMILLSFYFLLREREYLEVRSDGTSAVRPCACHNVYGSPAIGGDDGNEESHAEPDEATCGICEPQETRVQTPSAAFASNASGGEEQPLLPHEHSGCATPQPLDRGVKGGVLGVVQGACCPMSIVGTSFAASLTPPALAVFLVVFLFVSILGTACVATTWAYLTGVGIGTYASPKVVYRCSCGVTMLLGVFFLGASFLGHHDVHMDA